MLGALAGMGGGGGLSASGGTAGPSSATGSTSTYSGGNVGLTIAPSGVNIGSVLQPFQGSPETGGYGLSMSSRMGFSNGSIISVDGILGIPWLFVAGGAAAIIGVIAIWKKRR